MSVYSGAPELDVRVNDQPLPLEQSHTLSEVSVFQALSLPTLCELVFKEPEESALGNGGLLVPGVALSVGIRSNALPLFVGQVTAVEFVYGPSRQHEVRVRSYDVLHQLRKRQPVRSHVQLTVQELAKELVADINLSVEAEQRGPLWDKLVQHRQSDLDLLTEVLERSGLYFTVRESVLHLLTLTGVGQPISLALGDTLLETRIDVSSDPSCRSVETLGWDPWRAESHGGVADDARVGRDVEVKVTSEEVGGSGKRTLADETVQNDDQASAIAQAHLDRRVAGEVTFWGIAEGNPQLRPGARIAVDGVAKPLCGRYVIAKAIHTIDRQKGYITEIDTAPPSPRVRPRGTISTIGIVTQVEDPEGHGRVRVSLPSYGDLESDWLEVVSAGAGPKKGLIALPDVEDRVLVLMAHEDPAQALVIGGLYGTNGPPDAGVNKGAVSRYTFLTPGGQRIQLDDDRKSVRVENQNGNYLHLSPGRVRLQNNHGSFIELSGKRLLVHAETELELEAPGQPVVFRGQNIDFENA